MRSPFTVQLPGHVKVMSPPLITMADWPADRVMLSLAWMRISSVVLCTVMP